MSLRAPKSETEKHDETDRQAKHSAEPIFQTVESPDGAGTDRAHVIAIWAGLFIFAMVISQFGRPSHARQADFLRSAAKVAALGKMPQGVSVAGGSVAGGSLAGGSAAESSAAESSAAEGSARAAYANSRGAHLRSTDGRIADERELTPKVYVSHKYGVAWQYPRTYVLRKGANANLDLYGHPATESAFVNPGNAPAESGAKVLGRGSKEGVTLASVILPEHLYPGTDFQSASLTARVNSQISADQCEEFRRPSSDTGDDVALLASPETVGTIDFVSAEIGGADEEEDTAGDGGASAAEAHLGSAESATQTIATPPVATPPVATPPIATPGTATMLGIATREKFYHVYENAACYEFAMRVSIGGSQGKSRTTHVDANDVFDRLAEILTSVTIVPVRDAASPVAASSLDAHGN
jgi:hypothetical protein